MAGRMIFTVLSLALALAVLTPAARASECAEATVVAPVAADSWVDANSPLVNKGSDALLDVSGTSRALVRFTLPGAVPAGCVIEAARLRLYADSITEGTRVEVLRLASGWSEGSVTWAGQPATVGSPTAAWSSEGYMHWNVTSQVQAGAAHGFLVRDAAEATEPAGGHGFYSREKGESPPELVIRYAAPTSGEPPPPAPPTPAAVTCGQELTASVLVTNDLTDCPGDGLVIGAPRIIVDLDGHTVDGVGLGTGVRNDGHSSVTVRDGTVREFDRGVHLLPETTRNALERLVLQGNEVAGVEVFDAVGTEIRRSTVDGNGAGIALVSGSRATVVADNTLTGNNGAALLVRDSAGNRLERNIVSGGGDLGVGLERASGNVLLENVVAGASDGGLQIMEASHDNRVEGNRVSSSGDTGILVAESDGNELIANTSELMSDSGIALHSANDGVVARNHLGSNPGGLEMDGSSGNLIEGNQASGTTGTGIEVLGGSFDNDVVANTANANAAMGIFVSDEAVLEPGNRLTGNTANGNGSDGIVLAKGGHVVTANVARDNGGWGIEAGPLTIDGGGNVATGNRESGQCVGVVCLGSAPVDEPPDTTLSRTPAGFAFTGSDDHTPGADLRFECRLDDEEWHACASPVVLAGLAPGAHVFEVRAIDGTGNVDPTPAGHSWTIPEPPDTTIDTVTTTGASAIFAFSSGDPGATFECALDGAAFTACSSPREYVGLAAGAHDFRVRARTAEAIDATPATHAWTVVEPPDTTAPQTTVDSGPDGETTSTIAALTFSADEPATFECSLDGAAFAPCTSPAQYTVALGEHEFRVRATDAAGNPDLTPAVRSWRVIEPPDTTAPTTTIDSGPDAETTSTIAALTFSANEPATFECSLDGAAFASCTSPAQYTAIALGEHEFRVRATDAAGNPDASPARHLWRVIAPPDVAAPETTIDSGPVGQTVSRDAVFAFSADERATFECSVDGAAFAPCGSPLRLSGLNAGAHEFRVRAADEAGNVDASPAIRSWRIVEPPPDTTAPETGIEPGQAPGNDGTIVQTPADRAAPRLVGVVGLRKTVTATPRGVVKLRVGRFDEAVSGVLRLRTTRGRKLGVQRFTAGHGATALVTVRLTRAGRRVLAARRRLNVVATVAVSDGRGNSSTKTYRFTLKAPRR